MKLLKRNYPHVITGVLTSKQQWILKNSDASFRNQTISQSLLGTHYLKSWIKCDCKPDGPMMSIRHNTSGTFSLVSIHTSGEHIKICPFFNKSRRTESANTALVENETSFSFHKSFSNKGASKSRESGASVSTRNNQLFRLLATLFSRSGLSNIGDDEGFKGCADALHEAAKHFQLAGKPLTDHLFFGVERFHEARKHVASQNTNDWNHDRAHAIIIDVIDTIEKTNSGFHITKHFSRSAKTQFELFINLTDVRCHFSGMSLNKGPFVLIFTISSVSMPKVKPIIAPLKAYIAPVLSKGNWVIVDSHYERLVALQLQKSQQWFANNRDLQTTITKPLFYKKTPDGKCLPDFIVCSDDSCVVLDVVGSHNEKYLLRKMKTHKAMAAIGEVMAFDAIKADETNDFSNACFDAVKDAFLKLSRL